MQDCKPYGERVVNPWPASTNQVRRTDLHSSTRVPGPPEATIYGHPKSDISSMRFDKGQKNGWISAASFQAALSSAFPLEPIVFVLRPNQDDISSAYELDF